MIGAPRLRSVAGMTLTLDTNELAEMVQRMYRAVATEPHGDYHFELGRSLAARLGYPVDVLDRIPAGAIESFAGVGYFSTSPSCSRATAWSTSAAAPGWTCSSHAPRSAPAGL